MQCRQARQNFPDGFFKGDRGTSIYLRKGNLRKRGGRASKKRGQSNESRPGLVGRERVLNRGKGGIEGENSEERYLARRKQKTELGMGQN